MKLQQFLERLKEQCAEHMPDLMRGASAILTNDALRLIIADGAEMVKVDTLKIRLDDIADDGVVTLALAFCDIHDVPIVNVGRIQLYTTGSIVTIAQIANTLNFVVSG